MALKRSEYGLEKTLQYFYDQYNNYHEEETEEKKMKFATQKFREHSNSFCRSARKILITASSVCVHCGANENLSIDHIVPISKGGRNIIENAQILCVSCNSRKSNKL